MEVIIFQITQIILLFQPYRPFEEIVVFGSDKRINSINNSFIQSTREQREMLKIELSENIELNLCQFNNYVELLILSNQVLTDEVFKKILHSLDFLLANNMQLVYYSVRNIGSCLFFI